MGPQVDPAPCTVVPRRAGPPLWGPHRKETGNAPSTSPCHRQRRARHGTRARRGRHRRSSERHIGLVNVQRHRDDQQRHRDIGLNIVHGCERHIGHHSEHRHNRCQHSEHRHIEHRHSRREHIELGLAGHGFPGRGHNRHGLGHIRDTHLGHGRLDIVHRHPSLHAHGLRLAGRRHRVRLAGRRVRHATPRRPTPGRLTGPRSPGPASCTAAGAGPGRARGFRVRRSAAAPARRP